MRLLRPRNVVLGLVGIVLLMGLVLALMLWQALSAPLGVPGKYAADLRTLMLEDQPAEGEDGWPLVVELQAALDELDRAAVPDGWPAGERPNVDWTLLYAPEWEKRDTSVDRPAAIAGLRRGLAAVDGSTAAALLARLAAAPRFVRPTPEGKVVGFLMPELSTLRRAAWLTAARYADAKARGDGAAQAALLEQGLALGRAASAGTWQLDRLVGISAHALMFERVRAGLVADAAAGRRPDDATLASMQAAIDRQTLVGDVARGIRGARFMVLDTIEWTHTDNGRGDGRLAVGPLGTRSAADRFSGLFAPTKRETLAALDDYLDLASSVARLPEAQRADADAAFTKFWDDLPKRQVTLRERLPSLTLALRSEAEASIEREATRLMLALERHHVRHGAYPVALAALAPEFMADVPLDAVSGKPWGYRLLDADPAGRGYMLYSFGADGVDNGGVPALIDQRFALASGKAPNTDYVLNPPPAAPPAPPSPRP